MDKNLTNRDLEIALIKMLEDQSINNDDYNLIHKYLVKIKNDLKNKNEEIATWLNRLSRIFWNHKKENHLIRNSIQTITDKMASYL